MMNFPDSPTTGQQFVAGNIAWVWDGNKWTSNASMAAQGGYVPLAGGVMSGPLTLSADPSTQLGAATKEYVDAQTIRILQQLMGLEADLQALRSEAGFA
jgi:hypothetical protein